MSSYSHNNVAPPLKRNHPPPFTIHALTQKNFDNLPVATRQSSLGEDMKTPSLLQVLLSFQLPVQKLNLITEKANDGYCVDKMTWSFSSLSGEASRQIKGILFGIGRDTQEHFSTKIVCWEMMESQFKVQTSFKNCCGKPKFHYQRLQSNHSKEKFWKIYKKRSIHISAYSHFSGDAIASSCGKNGLVTYALQEKSGLKKAWQKYLHDAAQQNTYGKICKAACKENTIIAVKKVMSTETMQGYMYEHTSFQSTRATLITSMNILEKCCLSFIRHEQGCQYEKQAWAIRVSTLNNTTSPFTRKLMP